MTLCVTNGCNLGSRQSGTLPPGCLARACRWFPWEIISCAECRRCQMHCVIIGSHILYVQLSASRPATPRVPCCRAVCGCMPHKHCYPSLLLFVCVHGVLRVREVGCVVQSEQLAAWVSCRRLAGALVTLDDSMHLCCLFGGSLFLQDGWCLLPSTSGLIGWLCVSCR